MVTGGRMEFAAKKQFGEGWEGDKEIEENFGGDA